MPCPKFITCAAHARFRQRIRDINSTKSSKTAIRENFDPTKFSAIRYSLQPVGNHWKEAKNMQICFIIIISVQCFQLIMFIRVVHTLLVFILLASGNGFKAASKYQQESPWQHATNHKIGEVQNFN